ncbi:MAG TPA: glycosyltransferase family 1 protein [Acidimicrobiales bacterium]|nr:glycosyltransferase family 1 protein [Acidimicrobiales bacterium]
MRGVATVALYAHRAAGSEPSGIGRYVAEVTAALGRLGRPDLVYQPVSSPDGLARRPRGRRGAGPPGPRKALHASWCLLGRPRVDRWVGRPELVHVLYPSTPVPSSSPVVYTVHDLIPLRHPDWYRRDEVWAFRRAVEAARNAAAVVAVSSAVAGELVGERGFDAGRVHVVHPGVAGEYFAPVGEADVAGACARFGLQPGGYLVAVGALRTRKNLDVVLRALPLLGDVRLACVGPPAGAEGGLRRLVDELGLRRRVTFTGWLPAPDLPLLVKGAAAAVHPSIEEGFGMTPLEAMALGVPVVARHQVTTSEVVGDAALVVDGDEPGRWAEALRRVLEDGELRDGLIRAGAERSRRFTWEATAEGLADVHRLCLDAAANR